MYDVGKYNCTLGIVISLSGTTLTALGLVIQKFSHVKNSKADDPVVYYKQPWWWFGFTIFLAGQIINVVAMPLAPQAMLSSLGAWALVFNAIFAWAILSERLYALELLAIGGIVMGVLMVILTTPVGKGFAPDGTMDEIAGPLFHARFLSITAALLSFLFCFRIVAAAHMPDLVPLCWTLAASIAGAYTVTCFKCISTSMLVWSTARPFDDSRYYAVVGVAVFLCVTQVHLLNMALNTGRANFIVPIAFAFNLISQIAVGEAAFHEMGRLTPSHAIIYAGGIVLMLLCVVLCVRAKMAGETLESEKYGAEKSETPRAPLLPEMPHAATLPARAMALFSFDEADPFFKGRSLSLLSSDSMNSTYDCEAFPESFYGVRNRTYTVSVSGPLALA